MIYLLTKMITYNEDRTQEYDYSIESDILYQNISVQDMGVIQFQNLVKFN